MGLRPGSIQECSVLYGPRSRALSQYYDKQMFFYRATHRKPLPCSTEELGEKDLRITVKPVEFCFPVIEVVLRGP